MVVGAEAHASGSDGCLRVAVRVSAHEQQTGNTNVSSLSLSKFDEQVIYNPQLQLPQSSMNSEALNSKFAPAAKKTSAFEKDYESHYALLDIHSFFKNLKISCVLQLRNIIPLSVDPEVIKKDILVQLERIGKVVRSVHKQQNVWI